MQSARTNLGEDSALGALAGLVFAVGSRFAGAAVGLPEILLSGGIGLVVGLAIGLIARRL